MKGNKKMKKISSVLIALLIAVLLCFTSCADNTKESPDTDTSTTAAADGTAIDGIWASATYTEDKSFGEGEKTITVKVTAEERSVTFTIKTDKEILGDALLEHGIVEGENGPYGLYVKKVNGMTADYDIDSSYWSFNINGEAAATGVDGEKISDGASYELIRITDG